MPLWLTVVLLFLAVHRATRWMTRDELPLVKVPRDWAVNWLDPRDKNGNATEPSPLGGFGRAVAYLLECDWCMSAWVGGFIVWATTQFTSVPLPLLVWAAASSVTGLIAGFESRQEQRYKLADMDIIRRELELTTPKPRPR